MLNRDQKIYLIKKVDRFALSDRRIEAMKEYTKVFPIAEGEVKEISDLVCLREETIKIHGKRVTRTKTLDGLLLCDRQYFKHLDEQQRAKVDPCNGRICTECEIGGCEYNG